MSGGRIGKVRMKATGFEFRVIEGPREPANDMGAVMMRHAREISQWDGLVGSIVIGMFADGKTSVAYRLDDEKITIPRALIPSWLAEIARREFITDIEAAEIFDDKFEWVE